MNNRITLIIGCLVLVGGIILAAITPNQQAFLLDNVITFTPAEPLLSPPPTAPPIGPYNEYMPLVLDTVLTPVIPPTPTLEVEPTTTATPPPPTPPPTDEPG